MSPGKIQKRGAHMNDTTIWWLVTGGLVAAELMSGTFYLLMLAIGATAAALAGHMGMGLTVQLVTAALVGGSAAVLWRQRSLRHEALLPAALHLDIGETVEVSAWDAHGTAQVKHRGANWTAVGASGHVPSPGTHRIQAIQGSRLVLEKI
jgi:membrane protein implicated in regulation of membrane protease activity